MPETAPAADRCAIVWNDDPENRCELDVGHAGAHKYPHPPTGRRRGPKPAEDPDELHF